MVQQSNQYLLHRATRINSSINPNPSSMNNRSTIIGLRSTTATTTNRATILPSSAPTPRTNNMTPTATPVTTATNNDDPTRQSPVRQSTKSVFPLFFDVL